MNVVDQLKAVVPRSAMALLRATTQDNLSDLKRFWDTLVEHGSGAASLVSPDAAAAIDALVAFTSLSSLIVSLGYALWALCRFINSTWK